MTTNFDEPIDPTQGEARNPNRGMPRGPAGERPGPHQHPGRPGAGRRPGFGPGPHGGFGVWGNPPYAAGGGPFGARGPRSRTPRGGVRVGILGLLADRALNGYALMQAFAEKSGGNLKPGSGAVYPALGQLLAGGLIQVDADGTYSLTEHGQRMVEHQRDFLAHLFGADLAEPEVEPVAHVAYRKLTEAFQQLLNAGTEEQQARVAEKLDQLRRDIYRELSE